MLILTIFTHNHVNNVMSWENSPFSTSGNSYNIYKMIPTHVVGCPKTDEATRKRMETSENNCLVQLGCGRVWPGLSLPPSLSLSHVCVCVCVCCH